MLFLSPIMAANVDSTNTQQQNSIIENTHETHDIQVLNEKNMEKQVINDGDKKSLKEVKVDNIKEYKNTLLVFLYNKKILLKIKISSNI